MDAPAWISLGVTVIVGGAFLLLVLETHLLANHDHPITWYGRNLVVRWPGPALAISGALLFSVGMLFAHFIWDGLG